MSRGIAVDFLPAFETEEQKVLVLADRTADYAAELVLVVPALGLPGVIVGEVVGVQHAIAEIVVHIAVPIVGSAADRNIDHAASLMAIGSVVRRGNGGKLLLGVDAGGKIPLAAVVADDSTVHHEYVVAVSGARAVEFVAAVHVPSAGAGKTGRPKLLLRENHAWGQGEQHVALPAVQRQLLRLDRVEEQTPVRVGRIKDCLLPRNRHHFRGRLAHDQPNGQCHPLGHRQGDCLPAQRLESGGGHFYGVNAGREVRNRVEPVVRGLGLVNLVVRCVGCFHGCVWNCGSTWIRHSPGQRGPVLREKTKCA